MNARQLAVALAAFFFVGLGGKPESTLAAPITLMVDASASYLGTSLIGVPLSGSVVGDFNGTSLTFSGGSDIATTLTYQRSGSLSTGTVTVFDTAGVTLKVVGGNYALNLPALHLGLTSGTVSDGSNASVPTWSRTGGVGTVSGSLNLELTLPFPFGTSHPSLAFSASATPSASFNSSALLFGDIGLSDVGGIITLTLPFGMPVALGTIQLDQSDLGVIGDFITVGSALINGFLAALDIGLDAAGLDGVPIPGLVVASVETSTAAVPEPATLVLLVFGLAGLGFSRRKQR